MNQPADAPLLDVRDLKTWFPVQGNWFSHLYVRAVDGVSFSIRPGTTLALVGESGSGKTTVGRSILRLIPPTSGQVQFAGQDVMALGSGDLRRLRRRMQMIFQDPYGSLNPRMTVGSIIGEPLKVHGLCGGGQERRARVKELLGLVGLREDYAGRYPHEFSGGQRQRIGIARALASEPDFIVCDEPVSALDVSIQSQVLNLLSDLQDRLHLTYLFIAHNLAVVEHFASDVAVMYLGKIVEIADRDSLYDAPRHPYTQTLFAAVPIPDPTRRHQHAPLEGETPSPVHPPSGCSFHPRCPLTRQLAAGTENQAGPASQAGAGGPAGETVNINSSGRQVAVMRRCVQETPALLPLADNPSHCHACHFRR